MPTNALLLRFLAVTYENCLEDSPALGTSEDVCPCQLTGHLGFFSI